MECGNLVTVNDLWSLYLNWNVGNVNESSGPSITYMECWNLLTINDLWFFHTLYEMWEPSNGVAQHV